MINMTFMNLKNITERELVPGFMGKFIHSENMTFVYWNITAGASLPDHAHQHEQVVNMLEGEFELTVDGKAHIIEPGEVVIIPSNVKHSGKARTDCRIIDVFYPVREDYK